MSSPDQLTEQATGREPDRPPAAGDQVERLPPALRSMWRLCLLGFRFEPALMGTALVLALVAAVPDALLAIWFELLGEGLLEHRPGLLRFAVIALAVSVVATWLLSTISTRIQRRFRDKVTIALESHVARLQAGIATIAHQERPEYLDRLSVLREETYTLDHMYMSVFSTVGWLLRLAITVALLGTVNPVLVSLVLFAVPTVAATSWRPAVERAAQERGAQSTRLAAHLYALSTTASPGKELRVLGIGQALAGRRRAAWERWYAPAAAATGPYQRSHAARRRPASASPTPSTRSSLPGEAVVDSAYRCVASRVDCAPRSWATRSTAGRQEVAATVGMANKTSAISTGFTVASNATVMASRTSQPTVAKTDMYMWSSV